MDAEVEKEVFKRDGRIAVGDLVVHCLHDGTFSMAMIPEQTGLPEEKYQPKIMDRVKEDLGGDPFYRSLYVKILPNENHTELPPKDLALIDRHLKIGQLVKRGPANYGYVRSIDQTASARIYLSDEAARNDLSRELYIYKKPVEFFGKRPWKINDIVLLNGWLGEVVQVTNGLDFTVDFKNGTTQDAHAADVDIFKQINREKGVPAKEASTRSATFDINGIRGLFPGRNLKLPYKFVHQISSLRWIPNAHAVKPAKNSEAVVDITITASKLNVISVNWIRRVEGIPNASLEKPGQSVKNDADRENLVLVSHNDGLKIGDVRVCDIEDADWERLMAKWTWQNTIAKDYFLHRRRDKRPRLDEGSKEVLPDKPYPKKVFVEIMLTTSKASVEWIDTGVIENNIDSRDLVPVRYTLHFPGAATYHIPRHIAKRGFQALGPPLTTNFRYSVIQSIEIIKVKKTFEPEPREWWEIPLREKKDKTNFMVQNYNLAIGALEPTLDGEPTQMIRKCPIVDQFHLWNKNDCKVVTKMPNSTADFLYATVIGFFPDGRVRIKRQDDDIINVWPTDVVGLSSFAIPPDILDYLDRGIDMVLNFLGVPMDMDFDF